MENNALKVVAIGDVGGHYIQLVNTLVELGVDVDRALIPANLAVIQVGDLVHKGPDSDAIVELVDLLITKNSERDDTGSWYQCFGNHEMLHVYGGVQFGTYCDCSEATLDTIQSWWSTKKANIAVGIKHEYDEFREDFTIITHAGITMPWWRKIAHKTGYDASNIVRGLNHLMDDIPRALNNAGTMLGGPSSFSASPIWAESSNEVYRSWDGDYMPFSQVHGHTCPFSWERQQWYPTVPLKFRKKVRGALGQNVAPMRLDLSKRCVTMHNAGGGGSFFAIDPGFERGKPTVRSIPYLEIAGAEEIIGLEQGDARL